MKKPSQNLPQKLSRDEWDFSGVSADEIEACCYWEYARESPAVSKAVEDITSSDENLRRNACRSGASDALGNQCLAVLRLIQLHWPGVFPQLPWSRVRELSSIRGKFSIAEMWLDQLQNWSARPVICSGPAVVVTRKELKPWRIVEPGEFAEPSGAVRVVTEEEAQRENERAEKAGVYELTLPILGGSPNARGTTRTSSLVTIDWNYLDEQIAATFSENLQRLRKEAGVSPPPPKPTPRFIPSGKKRFKGVGSDNQASPGAALVWLGVYRRRQGCADWKEFLRLYPEKVEGSARIRKLREQFQKAESVLKLFAEKQ